MTLPEPSNYDEQFAHAAAIGDTTGLPEPITKMHVYLKDIAENGGKTPTGLFCGYMTPTTALPTTRPDGTPLELEDYVKPSPSVPESDYPFTVTDGTNTITFNTVRDRAMYDGVSAWIVDIGILQDTSETPVDAPASESLSGTASRQKAINIENVNALEALCPWKKETDYVVGNRVIYPNKTGYLLECTTAGESGSTLPSWPSSTIESGTTTITDGTVVWTVYDLKSGKYVPQLKTFPTADANSVQTFQFVGTDATHKTNHFYEKKVGAYEVVISSSSGTIWYTLTLPVDGASVPLYTDKECTVRASGTLKKVSGNYIVTISSVDRPVEAINNLSKYVEVYEFSNMTVSEFFQGTVKIGRLIDADTLTNIMSIRKHSYNYSVGAKVYYPGKIDYCLECITAGKTGSVVPTWNENQINDGTVVWKVYKMAGEFVPQLSTFPALTTTSPISFQYVGDESGYKKFALYKKHVEAYSVSFDSNVLYRMDPPTSAYSELYNDKECTDLNNDWECRENGAQIIVKNLNTGGTKTASLGGGSCYELVEGDYLPQLDTFPEATTDSIDTFQFTGTDSEHITNHIYEKKDYGVYRAESGSIVGYCSTLPAGGASVPLYSDTGLTSPLGTLYHSMSDLWEIETPTTSAECNEPTLYIGYNDVYPERSYSAGTGITIENGVISNVLGGELAEREYVVCNTSHTIAYTSTNVCIFSDAIIQEEPNPEYPLSIKLYIDDTLIHSLTVPAGFSRSFWVPTDGAAPQNAVFVDFDAIQTSEWDDVTRLFARDEVCRMVIKSKKKDAKVPIDSGWIPDDYLKLTGGTMLGNITFHGDGNRITVDDNTSFRIIGGTSQSVGASIVLHGQDYPSSDWKETFVLNTGNGISLIGKTNGSLVWNNKNVLTESALQTFYDGMYPVGKEVIAFEAPSVPTGITATWTEVSSSYENRYFKVSSAQSAKTNEDEQLPNIKGKFGIATYSTGVPIVSNFEDCLYGASLTGKTSNGVEFSGYMHDLSGVHFDASNSNSTYVDGGVVKPKTTTIKVWKRTA